MSFVICFSVSQLVSIVLFRAEEAAVRKAHARQLGLEGLHEKLHSLSAVLSGKWKRVQQLQTNQHRNLNVVRVWSLSGKLPFVVNWAHSNGDVA